MTSEVILHLMKNVCPHKLRMKMNVIGIFFLKVAFFITCNALFGHTLFYEKIVCS
jgi:hypothetical protein